MPQVRTSFPAQERGDPSADVSNVRGPLPKVVVVDAGEVVCMASRHAQDRVGGRDAGRDLLKRGVDDPRIAREQGLGHEDRPDLLARAAGRLVGEDGEVGGGGLERRPKSGRLLHRIGRRGLGGRGARGRAHAPNGAPVRHDDE